VETNDKTLKAEVESSRRRIGRLVVTAVNESRRRR